MNAKVRPMVAMFGALLYVVVGMRMLLSSSASLLVSLREMPISGSGGIGAVSVGVDELFALYGVLALAAIISNRMLSGWARHSERAVTRLYRAHIAAIVIAFVVMLAVPAAIALEMAAGFSLFPLTGVAWGAAFVVTAALLGTYALKTSSGSR